MTVARPALVAAALGAAAAIACTSPRMRGIGAPSADLARAVPDSFVVAFETSRGRFDVMARTAWAPVGTDRFYDLVRRHFYDDVYFYRVVKNFVAQFGLTGDSAVNAAWRMRRLGDDSVRHTNARGTLAFARSGAGTRTVQLFVNLRDNARLDTANAFGFPPFAEVVRGMEVVDSLYQGYGDSAPLRAPRAGARPDTTRRGPQQDSITRQGNAYLRRAFPKLDRVITARVVREWRRGKASGG
jgi:cyclophilin family peptidyl-prolyl cis-trans isomerase